MTHRPRTNSNFTRFKDLVVPFFFSSVGWRAWLLLILLAVFALSIAGLNVILSYIARDFMTAFALRERERFAEKLILYLLMFAVTTPVAVFYSYTEQRLALLWRQWLSREILRKYFTNRSYYKVMQLDGIDNPDQRIEEDIRSFTQTTLSLFLIFCNSILTIILFVNVLGTISVNLIIAVIIYAITGSIITFLIGRSLSNLNFAQLKKEADFRYKLVNVRDHAESIAFLRGDATVFTRVRQRLHSALENFRKIINLNRNLGFFVTFYNNLKPILPIIIVSPLYFDRQIEIGVVTQSTDAFVRVLEALSVLIQHFGTISAVAAVVRRLGAFNEVLEDTARAPHETSSAVGTEDAIKKDARDLSSDIENENTKGSYSQIISTEGQVVIFDRVTIYTPRNHLPLFRELSFEHREGGLLIVGPSGTGKTSILRALAGMWTIGTGRITHPPLRKCYFAPQRPYLILGSLRSQLLYSTHRHGMLDHELLARLRTVGLDSLLDRVPDLYTQADWSNLLSAGEQQQLAIARLILARPQWVFLDEATTAVDKSSEETLYGLISAQATAYMSIGFRDSLLQYHSKVLELKENGTWSLSSL